MSKAKAKPKGSSVKEGNGNITVDLGEAIDKKLRAVMGKAEAPKRAEVGRPDGLSPGGYRPGAFGGYRPGGYRPGMFGGYRPGANRPGGQRPGMFGGYRPWYATRESRFGGSVGSPFLGAGVMREVHIGHLVGGIAVGIAGNRALVRVTPDIIKVDHAVVHDAIAFVVGLIPLLAKQNSFTVGAALPGTVFLAGSLVDWILNSLNVKKGPSSIGSPQGGAPVRQGTGDALSASRKLADIASRVQYQQPPAAAGAPRIYAQAQ